MAFDKKKFAKFMQEQKEEAKENKSKGNFNNEKFWKPEIPKVVKQKTKAKVRFVPVMTAKGFEMPFVKVLQHKFQSVADGKWIYLDCPKTVNKPCPICEHSQALYDTEDPIDKKQAGKFYRKISGLANIVVLEDEREDNVGKLFLWKFNKPVFDALNLATFPPAGEEDEEKNFVDVEEGNDYKVIVECKGDGKRSYPVFDGCKFVESTSVLEGDVDEILDNVYSLEEELSEDKFMTYDKLKELFEVHGLGNIKSIDDTPATKKETKAPEAEKGDGNDDVPHFDSPEVKAKKTEKVDKGTGEITEGEDNDDFLKKLEDELEEN
jgi:hypothetical protein